MLKNTRHDFDTAGGSISEVFSSTVRFSYLSFVNEFSLSPLEFPPHMVQKAKTCFTVLVSLVSRLLFQAQAILLLIVIDLPLAHFLSPLSHSLEFARSFEAWSFEA